MLRPIKIVAGLKRAKKDNKTKGKPIKRNKNNEGKKQREDEGKKRARKWKK